MLFLLLRIPTIFIFENLCVLSRINGKNDLLGQIEIIEAILLLSFVLLLTPTYGIYGYVAALLLSPTLTFIGHSLLNGFPKFLTKWTFKFDKRQFWNYSIWSSLANVVALMVFLVDIILIGFLLNDEAVAEYKVAALIPTNLLILPFIFIKTDFKKIAENYLNKTFLVNYFKSFSLLFLMISIFILIGGFVLGKWLFSFLNSEYQPFELFIILLFGTLFSMTLWVPLSNMIGAFGKTKINTFIGIFTILINIILNIILIPKWELYGATISSVVSLVICGVLSLLYFLWYLKTYCE